jgi:ribosomal protein S12
MHRDIRRLVLAFLLGELMLFSACSNTTTKPTPTPVQRPLSNSSGPSLPSAPLGTFVSHFLAIGGQPVTKAATEGVNAQVQLHKEFNPLKSDDTYALLTQFGTILQISVPDMLNRSSDRPTTLTQYTDSLKNITIRAKRTSDDLTTHLQSLQANEKKQQSSLSDLNRQLSTAKRNNDFATAASVQQNVTEIQATIGQIRSQEQETKDLQTTYLNLIDVSAKRQAAIDQNREVLIAGLKVNDIPGIENLGVLQGSSKGGGNLFQGL